jgi:hypothetical protein
MFEQRETRLGYPVHRGTGVLNVRTYGNAAEFDEPPDAPIKRCAAVLLAAQLHEFKQLLMSDELGVAYLAKQRNIPFRADNQTVLCVARIPSSAPFFFVQLQNGSGIELLC